jgi:hypothetical protein
VAFEFPSFFATSSDALAIVESESWFARQEATSLVENVSSIALKENALVFLDTEVVAGWAELEVALSVLEVVAFTAVNLAAAVLEELEARRALVSDAFVVDELEVSRAFGESAGALRSEGVALLADLVTRLLVELVAGRARLSNALVADLLETVSGVAGDQDAFVVF